MRPLDRRDEKLGQSGNKNRSQNLTNRRKNRQLSAISEKNWKKRLNNRDLQQLHKDSKQIQSR